jgi:hypothetical protein
MFLEAKAPAEIRRYAWTPSFTDCSGIASYELTASGCTIDSDELDGEGVSFLVSGGTAASTATITATAESNEGEYFEATLYLPVIASPAQVAPTARDICNFALRKITGNGNTADAAELDDALERLSGIIAAWRAGGADIGAPFPLTANSVIYCPDYAVDALRFNLRLSCHDHYDAPITAYDADRARRGLQLVKHKNLPADREGAEFF